MSDFDHTYTYRIAQSDPYCFGVCTLCCLGGVFLNSALIEYIVTFFHLDLWHSALRDTVMQWVI